MVISTCSHKGASGFKEEGKIMGIWSENQGS